ncbi:hypothetical protein GCM10009625_11950 [Brachybacterium fresconis]
MYTEGARDHSTCLAGRDLPEGDAGSGVVTARVCHRIVSPGKQFPAGGRAGATAALPDSQSR